MSALITIDNAETPPITTRMTRWTTYFLKHISQMEHRCTHVYCKKKVSSKHLFENKTSYRMNVIVLYSGIEFEADRIFWRKTKDNLLYIVFDIAENVRIFMFVRDAKMAFFVPELHASCNTSGAKRLSKSQLAWSKDLSQCRGSMQKQKNGEIVFFFVIQGFRLEVDEMEIATSKAKSFT